MDAKPSNVMETDLTRLRTELDESKRRNACDACGGSGKPISGKPCMCRGTGLMSEAATYLREQLDAAVQRAERAEAASAAIREKLEMFVEEFERGENELVAAWGSERVSDAYAYARGALKPAYDFARAALSSSAGAALLAEVERLRRIERVVLEEVERIRTTRASRSHGTASDCSACALDHLERALAAALTPAPAAVCGKRCDHGSECLLMAGHDGGHQTQHDCVFYDAPAAGKEQQQP